MSQNRLTPSPGTLTDWYWEATIDRTGAVIYDVQHDGYPFARKVGLIKSYATVTGAEGPRFVPFDFGAEGMNVGNNMKLSRQKGRTPDHYYELGHEAYAAFKIVDAFDTDQTMFGNQMFSFTETSGSPRHETAGIAAAGRFYPSIHFAVTPPGSEDEDTVESLRFDYWFEPGVAAGGKRMLVVPDDSAPGAVRHQFQQRADHDLSTPAPQQAGVFRDRDASIVSRTASAVAGAPGSAIFSSAEKPLLWELVADGLLRGGVGGWDNVHIWGFNKAGLVSTPGMPFGCHLHWRWAASVTNLSTMILGDFTPDDIVLLRELFGREPELAGRGPKGEVIPGGPLIDPRTPDTDLRVAVVSKETAERFRTMTAGGEDDFLEMFRTIKPEPGSISKGTDMVVILSIVQHRPTRRDVWKSTVFPHGFFFPHAHDFSFVPEASLSFAGAYREQYLSGRPTRSWKRDPS